MGAETPGIETEKWNLKNVVNKNLDYNWKFGDTAQV